MSAAATAAGYLYASGRLRGRAQREQDQHGDHPAEKPGDAKPQRPRIARPRKEVRVAALPEPASHQAAQPRDGPEKPRRMPTIQYRTRRWRPSEA
jgi:hypothetical protein